MVTARDWLISIAMRIRSGLGLAALGLALPCMAVLASVQAGNGLPQGFVYLRDVDAMIAQDMRYAGPDNFVRRRASPLSPRKAALTGAILSFLLERLPTFAIAQIGIALAAARLRHGLFIR